MMTIADWKKAIDTYLVDHKNLDNLVRELNSTSTSLSSKEIFEILAYQSTGLWTFGMTVAFYGSTKANKLLLTCLNKLTDEDLINLFSLQNEDGGTYFMYLGSHQNAEIIESLLTLINKFDESNLIKLFSLPNRILHALFYAVVLGYEDGIFGGSYKFIDRTIKPLLVIIGRIANTDPKGILHLLTSRIDMPQTYFLAIQRHNLPLSVLTCLAWCRNNETYNQAFIIYQESIARCILNLPEQQKNNYLSLCDIKEEPPCTNKLKLLKNFCLEQFGFDANDFELYGLTTASTLVRNGAVSSATASSSASSSSTTSASSESPNSNIQAQNSEPNIFQKFFAKIRSASSSSSNINISLANSVSVNAAVANKLSHYSDNNQSSVSVDGETLHEQYSDLMQEYLLNFIGHPDNANSKKFVSLGLTPKKEWCDSCRPEPENDDGDLPEVEDVMDIPVRLHTNEKNRFNLATLINLPLQADGKRLHPHTRRPFKLIEILPAEDIQKEINAAIKMAELNQTNKLTAPTPSAPPMEPINNPIPSAPPINELELINADSVEIQPPSEPYPVIIDPTPQLRKHDAINDDGDIAEEINDDKLPSHHLTIDNNSTLPANYSSTSNMIVALDLDIATANNSSTSSNSQQQKQEPADDILAKAPAAPNDKLENKHVDVNEIIAAAAASENKAAGTDKRKTPTMAC